MKYRSALSHESPLIRADRPEGGPSAARRWALERALPAGPPRSGTMAFLRTRGLCGTRAPFVCKSCLRARGRRIRPPRRSLKGLSVTGDATHQPAFCLGARSAPAEPRAAGHPVPVPPSWPRSISSTWAWAAHLRSDGPPHREEGPVWGGPGTRLGAGRTPRLLAPWHQNLWAPRGSGGGEPGGSLWALGAGLTTQGEGTSEPGAQGCPTSPALQGHRVSRISGCAEPRAPCACSTAQSFADSAPLLLARGPRHSRPPPQTGHPR